MNGDNRLYVQYVYCEHLTEEEKTKMWVTKSLFTVIDRILAIKRRLTGHNDRRSQSLCKGSEETATAHAQVIACMHWPIVAC